MAPRLLRIIVAFWLAAWTALAAAAADTAADADEQLLQDAGVATDGPGLLAFFRARIPTPERRAEVAGLICQLASPSYKVRRRASQRLPALGRLALPLLTKALTSP